MPLVKSIVLATFVLLFLAGCGAISSQTGVSCPQIPLPEQAKIITDDRTAPEGERIVIFQTEDAFPSIQQFYNDAFLKEGWEIILKTDAGVRYGRRSGIISYDCQIDVVINQGRDNKIKDGVVKDANLGK